MPDASPYDYIEPPAKGFVPPPPSPSDAMGLQPRVAPPSPPLSPAPPDEVIPPQLPSPAPPPAVQVAAKDESGDAHKQASNYIQRTMALEGSGKDPNSSAVGGFLDGTWVNLVRKNVPEAASLPDAQVLAARDDPVLRARMVAAYAQENAAVLQKSGIEPDPNTLRLAHWFGAEGAKRVLTADPGTPIDKLFPPNVIASNPVLSGKTAGDVVDLVHKQMSTPTLKEWATGNSTALQEHAKALTDEADRLSDQYHTDAAELMRQANAATPGSKERDDAIAELRQRERHYTDEYERISKAPPALKPVDALANFGSAGTIIALIGGLFARKHMTAALSAAGAAMKAINENNYEQFLQSYKAWERQSSTALEMVRLHNEEIRNLIDDKRMAESEKNARLGIMYQSLGMDRQADMMRLGAHEKVFTEQASLERMMQTAGQYRQQYQIGVAANLEAKYLADGMDSIEAKRKAGVESGIIPASTATSQTKGREAEVAKVVAADVAKFKTDNPDASSEDVNKAEYQSRLKHEKEMAAATRMPRSASAMATQKFLEENPDATSADLVRFQAQQARAVAVERAFGAGAEAKNVTSLNTVADHVETYEEVANALQNGDIPRLNALRNQWRAETGDERPIDFAVVQEIASREISRAVIGGPGAAEDRAAMAKQIGDARSPEQLAGAFKEIKRLVAGRLDSLGRQYAGTDAERRRHFEEEMLSPIARKELLSVSREHQGMAPTAQPQAGALPKIDSQAGYDALPSGGEFIAPDGKHMRKP